MREQVREVGNFLANYFMAQGMDADVAHFLNMLINIVVVGVLWFVIHFLTKRLVLTSFQKFTNQTKTTFDDYLVKSNFPRYISNIFPLLLLILTVPIVFEDYPKLLEIFEKLVDIYIILLTVLIGRSLVRTTTNFMKRHERYHDKPLESYAQVLMIIFWSIGLIFIFSEITEKSVLGFLISLGAASAIILFIFKDTILGFIASIQVSVNDIVRIGDWITFSKYGADGFVTEINLATVRVQNWDNTYTTIPTYYLISDSFHNWRGMQESPGRRIKRSINIKQNSIRFVNDEDIAKFEEFGLIGPYIKERQEEINAYNKEMGINKKHLINGRHQTNLGIFRQYALSYLKAHPKIHQEMTMMVRHLPPTTQGIPIEIYCFSADKRWEFYEAITADIFDHLIAAIPYFDLQLFESPSGDDILKALKPLQLN
ncbi:mechanosensitive ion channel family protein [Salinimicrobium sediminilitoris]|uniref:mechanosensitive ion channel family protein n=1 Tax=Salinimicrobium sediminilitoris TaxID=2876715 RepID=UPI001E59303F|nr:mechanosensitive ion channel domain-containing protein [Salinimicrobium sediminilitoris]MCC8360307.1 mechanosensitive ion channel family protein [Salinimicrobium sediminilitoris]